MKRYTKIVPAGVLLAACLIGSAQGATLLLSDNYNVTGSGSGFALGSGLNSGITSNATRITGTLAAGPLRYFKAEGTRNNNLHYITNNTKFATSYGGANTLVSFSPDGTALANFGPALNTTAATAEIPSVYEVTVRMANMTATGANRVSFGISSGTGLPQAWDFGIELYRAADTETTYTLQKRIDSKSNGGQADTSAVITNNFGVYGQEVFFLLQVWDAGPESTTFNSRLKLSVIDGATTNLIYDTAADSTDLPYGWRFFGANRYLYFYAAGNAGPATFDDVTLTSISRPSDPVVRTWTGGGASDNWSDGANWGGSAPNSGDWLIFGAPVRQNNVNDLTALLSPWLTFTTGNYVLSGNEWSPLTGITNLAGSNTLNLAVRWQGNAAKTWSIASGTEIALTGPLAVDLGGDHTILGGGTLRIANTYQLGSFSSATPATILADGRIVLDGSGSQFTSRGGFRIGGTSALTPSVCEVALSNGASINLTVSGAGLRVGNGGNNVTNRLLVNNSTISMSGGDLGVPWTASTTGVVVQVGGNVSDAVLVFNHDGAGMGTYTLKNGLLEPRRILRNYAGGFCGIYFDGATLRTAPSASSNFMAALDVAEIQAGGLILDSSSTDISLASPFSGSGTLTKSGTSTATFTGTNVYSGNTIVQAGKLVLPTTQTNAAAIQVADGAGFGVIVSAPGTTFTAGSLNLAGAASTLSFDLGTFSNPTAPLGSVSTLSSSASVTVNVSGGSIAMTPGTVTLLKWTSASPAPTFVQGSLPAHINGNLVFNPNSIDLVITSVQGFRWTGAADNNWDNFTINWLSLLNNTATAYTDGFLAEFVDGAANPNINLTTTVSPGLLKVANTTTAYSVTGGTITTPLLRKTGTNSFTRIDATDAIAEIELNEGSYVYQTSTDVLFTNLLTDTTAAGTFVKQGAGAVTMNTASPTYDGAIRVSQGILRLGTNSPSLGSTNGPTIVDNGATLDLANVQAPHEPVICSGEGVAGQGAIANLSLNGGVQNNLTDVTMVGDTTFGCANPGRWDIRIRTGTGPGPGLRGNGFNLTKVGGGVLSISSQRVLGTNGLYWDLNLGDVLIKEGGLYFEEAVNIGDPSKKITLLAGATLNFFDLGITNPVLRTIIATNANINCGGQVGHTNVLNGPLQLEGNIGIRPNNAIYLINGLISGNASLRISAGGTGRVMLNGANTFTGDTVVTNGVLGGSGSIAGNLVMLDGTNSPGMGVGTFTVAGNATLAGTTFMELDPGATPKNDQLSVGGTISGGGTLLVQFLPGAAAPSAGDVFQLFNKAVTGFTNISLPDLSGYGALAWDTNNLAVNGSIAIVGTVPPTIGNVGMTGSTFTFSGTGGTAGATYYIVTSPDVAAPMSAWVPVETNVFGPGGTFSFSTNLTGAGPQAFFRLQIP